MGDCIIAKIKITVKAKVPTMVPVWTISDVPEKYKSIEVDIVHNLDEGLKQKIMDSPKVKRAIEKQCLQSNSELKASNTSSMDSHTWTFAYNILIESEGKY